MFYVQWFLRVLIYIYIPYHKVLIRYSHNQLDRACWAPFFFCVLAQFSTSKLHHFRVASSKDGVVRVVSQHVEERNDGYFFVENKIEPKNQ